MKIKLKSCISLNLLKTILVDVTGWIMSPSNSYTEVLVKPQHFRMCLYLQIGLLNEQLHWKEIIAGSCSNMTDVIERRDTRGRHRRNHVKSQGKDANLPAKEREARRNKLSWDLDLGLLATKTKKINFCCFNQPVCDTF